MAEVWVTIAISSYKRPKTTITTNTAMTIGNDTLHLYCVFYKS